MSNSEVTDPLPTSDNVATENPEITKFEKIIIGIFLVVLSLLVITILRTLAPTPRNIILVQGLNPSVFSFHGIEYAFSVDASRVISNSLPKHLDFDQEWSPDGQWIVSSIVDDLGNGTQQHNIYVMKTDGSHRTLVPTPSGGRHPTWSPNGKQIAYYDNGSNGGIYITNDIGCLLRGESCAPKSRILVHYNSPWLDMLPYPDWSPDGRLILYHDMSTNLVYTIATDGQSSLKAVSDKMTQNGYSPPRWSPDGTKVLGTCLYESVTNICVMNRDGSNLTYLTKDTSNTDIRYPRWSPDGQKIAYIKHFSKTPIYGVWAGQTIYPDAIFIMNADGGGIAHLPYKNNLKIRWFTWIP
jgi:Tol biopolymer transport system component